MTKTSPTRNRTSARRTLALGGITAVAAASFFAAAPAHAETEVAEPSSFTSAFTVMATPDQVVNNDSVATPGQPGATGEMTFRINSDLEIICYDITLTGVTGEYQSPAKTATHIHQAAVGKAGPPRIAFPNPAPVGDGPRTSSGCLQGPFTTGIQANGADTGAGFSLTAIEADPAGFAGDSHTASFAAGVVRGQLSQVPVGGLQTGGGAAAAGNDAGAWSLAGLGATAALGAAGVVVVARRRTAS
ncbi:CHRD domain-containing protein [Rathayibacter tanaceti]|uniref:CHRD domain protein n=2 Tax=Rathayibacter tanaceti TaxID=1671680 RepID=A0A166HA81_9MICO|nr:CHRD domain-containing protein [Rathayibacter tanaceti]KZX20234.1 CHRD domain protein [Rathayibacter tanaceti]QHC56544.1 CHRD domain-containing protein [Rathayibacter tanaceti]TCO36758.1 CHRD domain-containing protein [Rathayibacter tanaceti]